MDFKKAYDSVRREVLYDTVIEFGTPMKLVRLIKMTETWRCFIAIAFQLCLRLRN